MKKKSMALYYKIIVTTVITALVIFLLILSLGQGANTTYSIYSKSRNGLMAIYNTLKNVGYDIQVCLDPLSDTLPDGTLFVLSPQASPSAAEINALKTWVARGNTLVCSVNGDASPLGQVMGSPAEPGVGTKSTPVLHCSLTDGVTALRVRTMFDVISETFSFGELSVLPQMGIGSQLKDKPENKPEDADAVALLTLFTVGKYPVAGIAAWGKGRVIVVGDPQCFTNILAGRDDNAIFVTNILQASSKTGSRTAIFYEYGNGYQRMMPGAGLIRLIDKPVRTALIIFTIAFLLLVVIEAQRFGPVRELAEKTRFRSEYLGSLADLLKRGGGTDIVLDELGRRFIDDITKQLGLGNKTSISLIVDTAKSRGLEKDTLLKELLQEAGKVHGSVSDESALLVARQWYKMRKEISTLR